MRVRPCAGLPDPPPSPILTQKQEVIKISTLIRDQSENIPIFEHSDDIATVGGFRVGGE